MPSLTALIASSTTSAQLVPPISLLIPIATAATPALHVFLALLTIASSVLQPMYAKAAIHCIPLSTMLASSVLLIIVLPATTTVFVLHVLLDIHPKMDIAIQAALEDAHKQAAMSILVFAPAAQLNSLLTPSTMSVLLVQLPTV